MRASIIAIGALIAMSVPGSTSEQQAPKRAPELQVLDRFTGEWEITVTNKKTGEKFTTIQSCKWSRKGTFILSEDQDTATKKESHFLATFDVKTKQYRACFISDEYTVPLLGTWDGKTQTMNWKSADTAFNNTTVDRFIGKDQIEWTMTVTSPEGKVVLELSANQSRRKK